MRKWKSTRHNNNNNSRRGGNGAAGGRCARQRIPPRRDLDFPSFLVTASQVNRFWRGRATNRAFHRLFRARLGCRPRPLGFYVGFCSTHPCERTKFVAMSQHPDLAGVFSRANFGTFGHSGRRAHVLDCRNGRVLVNQLRYEKNGPYIVLSPLDEPPAMTILPPVQPPFDEAGRVLRFLLDDCGKQPSCLFVSISSSPPHEDEALMGLALLRYGSWVVDRTSCATAVYFTVPAPFGYYLDKLLVRDKLYLLSSHCYILLLDLASITFLVIQLPDGVSLIDYNEIKTYAFSRSNDSGFYFIWLSGVQIYIWLCKIDGDGASTWVLEDRFSLYEAFGHFANQIWKTHDEINNVVHHFGPGDNAEFVFLVDIDGCEYKEIFYLNIRTRKVEVAYRKRW